MRELELLALQTQLERDETPYALATVVAVRGSASARPGSKCLISREGKNLWGWVGGGCAESFTIAQALEAIAEDRPRVITADLDDEVFGLGMPCGGVMDIYLEPKNPRETIPVPYAATPALRALADHFGWRAEFHGTAPPSSNAESLVALAQAVAAARGKSGAPLSGGEHAHALPALPARPTELLVLGHSRITEELAKLGALLEWPVRVYGLNLEKSAYPAVVKAETAQPDYAGLAVKPDSFVVVASHHKGDHHYVTEALRASAAYVGLVASGKRAGLVLDHVRLQGGIDLSRVHPRAGIDIGAKNPAEIALSIAAELVEAAARASPSAGKSFTQTTKEKTP